MSPELKKFDTIIFDCDGTLTDSEEGYFHCFNKTLNHFGCAPVTLEKYQLDYSGKVLDHILSLHFEDADIPEGFVEYHFSEEKNYVLPYTKAIAGVESAVTELGKNYNLAIASNAGVRVIVSGLKKVGLMRYFDEHKIFSKDQVAFPKPAPDVYLHAVEKIGADTARTVVIEDSEAGVRSAKAAGIHVIGFSGSSANRAKKSEILQEAGADIVFNDWKDILNHIKSL